MKKQMRWMLAGWLAVSGTLVWAGDVTFTAKPKVTKVGAGAKIEFAVSTNTDVAIYVENAGGEIIRHLAAGVLGTNAPAPFARNSLKQELVWDGKADFAKPAEGGPFQVRVALGLKVRYDKVAAGDQRGRSGGTTCMATGPDGALYLCAGQGSGVPAGENLWVYDSAANYLRTVQPWPSRFTPDQVRGFAPVTLDGRPAPAVYYSAGTTRGTMNTGFASLSISGDGKTICFVRDRGCYAAVEVGSMGADGSCPNASRSVPVKFPGMVLTTIRPNNPMHNRVGLAVSDDGRTAWLSNLKTAGPGDNYAVLGYGHMPAVFRMRLPEGEASLFFGETNKAGKADTQLGGSVRGLALDGKGRLLIADTANDRVVIVSEKDGAYVGEFASPRADSIAVNRKSGAIYVVRQIPFPDASVHVTRFVLTPDGKSAKETYAARMNLPRDGYAFVADGSAATAVLWVAGPWGELMRFEDLGDKFSDSKNVAERSRDNYCIVGTDRARREVYCRDNGMDGWIRYNEITDKIERVNLGYGIGGGCAPSGLPHPDGSFLTVRYGGFLEKVDRSGKILAWEKPFLLAGYFKGTDDPAYVKASTDKTAVRTPISMNHTPNQFGIRESDGHIFVFSHDTPDNQRTVTKSLYEYLPSGERVGGALIQYGNDNIVGPRFDAQGNIYIAEAIKPKGWQPPSELVTGIGVDELNNQYGSIIKYTPKGGTLEYDHVNLRQPGGTPAKRDPSWQTIECISSRGAGRVAGAEWMYPGISYIGFYACNCEKVNFDVDPFGRVFLPDTIRFRVQVLDTAGNELTRFGGYGNAENMGPDSPVMDPKTGKLRPRSKDDPAALKSPFAEPEIAFAWLLGVGVTDRYVYTSDPTNRRLLKLKQTYAAEETVPVR
jgi:hypothetical protein